MNQNLPFLSNEGYLFDLNDEDLEGLTPVSEFYNINQTSFNHLILFVKDLVEADCHAIVMDGEVIYNTYRDLSYRDNIIESFVRKEIIEDCRVHLFVPLLRKKKDFSIEIFMFKTNSWKIVIEYKDSTGEFVLSKKI